MNWSCRHRYTMPALTRSVLLWMLLTGTVQAYPEGRPEPLALLRGVVAARQAVTTGRFEYVVRLGGAEPSMRGGQSVLLSYVVDGAKRHVKQVQRNLVIEPPDAESKQQRLVGMNFDREQFVKLGLGKWRETTNRVIYDGTQMIAASSLATNINLDKPAGPGLAQYGLFFDLRALGLFITGGAEETVESSLEVNVPNAASVLGREKIGDRDAWHVILRFHHTEGSQIEKHLWIGDQEGFPVYRTVNKEGSRVYRQVDCEYRDPIKTNVLPIKVRRQDDIEGNGVARLEMALEEVKAEYGAEVNAEEFTLASLKPAIGASITDRKLMRIVGYWDGTGITTDLAAVERIKRIASSDSQGVVTVSRIGPFIALGVLAVIVILASMGWLWTRRMRATRI
jgi:hypothetical protein